jgi:hypothetical protein
MPVRGPPLDADPDRAPLNAGGQLQKSGRIRTVLRFADRAPPLNADMNGWAGQHPKVRIGLGSAFRGGLSAGVDPRLSAFMGDRHLGAGAWLAVRGMWVSRIDEHREWQTDWSRPS